MKYPAKKEMAIRLIPVLISAAFAGSLQAADEKLEEVIVTAQKRTERLQDVPISLTAISGSQLENRGIIGASTLEGMVPNLQIKQAPSQSLTGAIGIRGIYAGQPAIWADPSVGIYVDGVFVGKNQGALFDLIDLERVEVLRGPQGTLFGRNTEAGAISLVSRRPSGEFSGQIGFEFGNHGYRSQKISMDLPRFGIMKLSVALRNEERDGWVKNPNGKDWGSRDRTGARLAASFDISPKFKIDYTYDNTNIDETPTPSSLYSTTGYGSFYPTISSSPTNPNPFSAGSLFAKGFNGAPLFYFAGPLAALAPLRKANLLTAPAADLAPYVSKGYPSSIAGTPGHKYFQELDVDGHALTATYDLNANNTLKYIGAYRKMALRDNKDLDGTPVWFYDTSVDTHYKSYSHEFQWIGNTDRLNYVLGYYFFKDDGKSLNPSSGTQYTMMPAFLGAAAIGYSDLLIHSTTNAKAFFGQVDYKVTTELTATLGVRRTSEDKGGTSWRTSTCPVGTDPLHLVAIGGTCPSGPVTYKVESNGFVYAPFDKTTSYSATTPVFALNYKVNDGLNVYGRIAKGFKSGGFPLEASYVVDAKGNVLSDPRKPFSAERSKAYEIGFKSNFADGKGQLNGAIFRTDGTNFQTSVLPPGTLSPVMLNAGKTRYEGFELEGMFALAPGWRLQFGYGYLDAKFKELSLYNYLGTLVDASGNTRVAGAPKHTLNITLDGKLAQTSVGALRGIVDANYSSKYYFYPPQVVPNSVNGGTGNTVDFSEVSAMTKVNAKLLLAGVPIGGPGAANVSLWARNLTNVKKKIAGIDYGGLYQTANFNEPRMYGVSVDYKW